MKHYGDICKINGASIEAVDVITGGSPCQDLSVAGKRAGLAGSRSGLFMEQVRIIKEMRDEGLCGRGADEHIRPRFMVWENVYGAFSSNGGEDFRAVLEETARIKDKDANIPRPPKGGWPHAGVIVGDGYSIAWRGHDAQWWGVPQRRKRICLLADFEGDAAARILFESELWRTSADGMPIEVVGDIGDESRSEIQPFGDCLPGNPESRGKERERTADTVKTSIGETGGEALRAEEHGHQPLVYGISAYDSNAMNSPNPNSGIYEADTARTLDLNGGSPACNQGGMAVVMPNTEPYTSTKASYHQRFTNDGVAETLVATDYKDPPTVNGLDRASYNQGANAQFDFSVEEEKIGAQVAKGPGAVATNVVRRLTPTECLRLQGFPDGWYDIGEWEDSKGKKKKDSDSAKYKAAGNSIALPFWEWLAKRIVCEYDRPIKMASLFDGIGGFPLAFLKAGAEPVWASEIEDFPIAVTKVRFPEGEKPNIPATNQKSELGVMTVTVDSFVDIDQKQTAFALAARDWKSPQIVCKLSESDNSKG